MKFGLILLFAISYISFSDACSCAGIPGLESYCEATFGGTFKVVGPSYYCGEMEICYPIEIVQQFRGAPVSATVLKTNDNSAACGVYLEEGNTYFIATNPVDEETFHVYSCGLLQNWTSMTCCEMIAEAKKLNCKNYTPSAI
ncbi:metalloproteinase inhibitor 2-like [Bradysia coprophila]|uniref:metalloproteinase inhibitor 2-like n=1 Tax=Bradysia coprophila TaxID=38358 RepID=UPI00187DA676|nr:metalloproteinase inhibitor 2-like [Bradysia coprophila]